MDEDAGVEEPVHNPSRRGTAAVTSAAGRSGWRAALIGVSSYTHLPAIPAASNNVAAMARLLTSPTGGGLADQHCTALVDPEQSTQVGAAVAAVRSAEDVLLVYYTGHGLLDQRGQLYLALRGSNPSQPDWSSVSFALLRNELIASRAKSRILILDCCFSGRAFEAMSDQAALVNGQIDIRGTYTIASSAANEPSIAPKGAPHTAFTAALLEAATTADLTLDELYTRIDEILQRGGHPRPQRRSVNAAGGLRLFTVPGIRHNPDGSVVITPPAIPDKDHRHGEVLYMQGRQCAERGQLSEAERLWRQAASRGHVIAMCTLANLLSRRGRATESRAWYRKAADQGDIQAMLCLACASYKVNQFDEAEHWWRKATKVGNSDAMHNLAILLRARGRRSEAERWWHKAGHEEQQRNDERLRCPPLG
ncbi:tetratricopeptide repeat protein [Nocardia yamanashiensis]|uniref:caspase, EACC1-associated type n=1 Tax=Nocardia yamanashiensis TaxID=209247 RepID=UPI001E5F4D11|nr:tetratricopeptide repeat protein [Nocardia yamanashiensis]UGT43284.1 tetratricopeptide repeat protein [Nocardia yamanashiensis]